MVLLPVQNGNSLGAPRYSAIINATAWTVMHEMIFEKPENLIDMALEEGATAVIKFPVLQQLEREFVFRGLLSCMTLTKALLGIRCWWLLTPYQLARYLLANGGSLVKVSEHGKSLRRQQKAETRSSDAA